MGIAKTISFEKKILKYQQIVQSKNTSFILPRVVRYFISFTIFSYRLMPVQTKFLELHFSLSAKKKDWFPNSFCVHLYPTLTFFYSKKGKGMTNFFLGARTSTYFATTEWKALSLYISWERSPLGMEFRRMGTSIFEVKCSAYNSGLLYSLLIVSGIFIHWSCNR